MESKDLKRMLYKGKQEELVIVVEELIGVFEICMDKSSDFIMDQGWMEFDDNIERDIDRFTFDLALTLFKKIKV